MRLNGTIGTDTYGFPTTIAMGGGAGFTGDTTPSNGLLNNLQSYWKFDANGSFPDSHGSNTGTINGATFTASGKINGGYIFDGINDYIIADDTLSNGDTTREYTFGCWFKISSSNRGYIMEERNGGGADNVFQISSSGPNVGKITFTCMGGSALTSAANTYNDGNWHLAGMSKISSTTAIAYIDGVSEGSVTAGAFDRGTQVEWGRTYNSGNHFTGSIDESFVYTAGISADQWASLYNSGSGLSYDNFTT